MTTDARTPEAARLLDLVADHMLEHGISGVSLSRLAKDIGSNNRMLLYYFGSKEALFAAGLATAYERFPRLRGTMAHLAEGDDLATALKAGWRGIRAPQNLPYLRLFFEAFALAARSPEENTATLLDVSTDWPAGLRRAFVQRGWNEERASAVGLQVLAVWRGLQFALLEGADPSVLDTAHDEMIDALLRPGGQPGVASPGPLSRTG